MRKMVESTVTVSNKAISEIHEVLTNTGIRALKKSPRSNQLTKDIIEVLNKHKMIDVEDEIVEFNIVVRS